MKKFITLSALILASVSFNVSAFEYESYQVDQAVTVKKDSSGVEKALCKAYDSEGVKVVSQIVTVVESFDTFVVVEFNLPYELHAKVVTVTCK